jgi:hypothetical protein
MRNFNLDFDMIENTLSSEEVKAGENGTGYFDGLVHADFGLAVGQRAKFTDRHNRRGIVLITQVGNVVIFERYPDGAQGVLVHNEPRSLESVVVPTSSITDAQYGALSGIGDENAIATTIGNIVLDIHTINGGA